MKSIFKLSGKLLMTFIATGAIAFVTMMMCLSANVETAIKIAVGALFIVFIYYMAWSSSSISGEEDTKGNRYKPYKGFVSASITMLPAFIIAVIYLIATFHGWDGTNRAFADGLYMILYLLFLSFTPLLSLFVPSNPAFTIDFAQPAISSLDNIAVPNAVSAPLFFIPILVFVVVAGIGYMMGHKERVRMADVVKRIKNNK